MAKISLTVNNTASMSYPLRQPNSSVTSDFYRFTHSVVKRRLSHTTHHKVHQCTCAIMIFNFNEFNLSLDNRRQ